MCYCKSAEQKIQSGCWAMEPKVCKASGSMVPEHTCGLTISSLLNSQQGSKSTSEIEPKKSVRGGCTCCMPGCCSDMKQDLELPFHKFPKDESTKEQRIDAMKRKGLLLPVRTLTHFGHYHSTATLWVQAWKVSISSKFSGEPISGISCWYIVPHVHSCSPWSPFIVDSCWNRTMCDTISGHVRPHLMYSCKLPFSHKDPTHWLQ